MNIYIRKRCPYCIRLLSLLEGTDMQYTTIDVGDHPEQNAHMMSMSGESGVPTVEMGSVIIPDYDTEETLIQDIQWLMGNPDASLEDMRAHTMSKLVYNKNR